MLKIQTNGNQVASELMKWIGDIQAKMQALGPERLQHSADFLRGFLVQNLPTDVFGKISIEQTEDGLHISAEDPQLLVEYASNIEQAKAELDQVLAEEDAQNGMDE